jgi:hypothetical protein
LLETASSVTLDQIRGQIVLNLLKVISGQNMSIQEGKDKLLEVIYLNIKTFKKCEELNY